MSYPIHDIKFNEKCLYHDQMIKESRYKYGRHHVVDVNYITMKDNSVVYNQSLYQTTNSIDFIFVTTNIIHET